MYNDFRSIYPDLIVLLVIIISMPTRVSNYGAVRSDGSSLTADLIDSISFKCEIGPRDNP